MVSAVAKAESVTMKYGARSTAVISGGIVVMWQDQRTLESHRRRGAIRRSHTERVVEVILIDVYETVVTLRGSGESLVSDSWRGVVQGHVHGSRADLTLAVHTASPLISPKQKAGWD
jgi:hypothetical protein